MMERVVAHGEAVARAAQRRRLAQIAATLKAAGVSADVEGEAVVGSGRSLIRRWLTDSAIRFAGRARP